MNTQPQLLKLSFCSEAVKGFIQKHQPQDVRLTTEIISQGLPSMAKVVTPSKKEAQQGTQPHLQIRYMDHDYKLPLNVQVVTYTPYLDGGRIRFVPAFVESLVSDHLERYLLEHFGLRTVEVKLEQPIVGLDTPEWIGITAENPTDAWTAVVSSCPVLHFADEQEALLDAYYKQGKNNIQKARNDFRA